MLKWTTIWYSFGSTNVTQSFSRKSFHLKKIRNVLLNIVITQSMNVPSENFVPVSCGYQILAVKSIKKNLDFDVYYNYHHRMLNCQTYYYRLFRILCRHVNITSLTFTAFFFSCNGKLKNHFSSSRYLRSFNFTCYLRSFTK